MRKVIFTLLMIISVQSMFGQVQYKDVDKQALSEILRKIEKRNNVSFAFDSKKVETYLISFDGGEYTLDELLEKIFKQTKLDFEFVDPENIAIYDRDIDGKVLCGYLRDSKTNHFIGFATVTNDQLTKGVESDENGYFEITVSPEDKFYTCSFLGYQNRTIDLTKANLLGCKTYELEVAEYTFETITVTEYIDDGILLSKDVNNVEIHPDDMSMLPGSVERDFLSTLQFLPGISSPTESFDGLSVRGGTPDQNLVLWDDIPMYQSSHMFGAIPGFNPFVVSSVNVYKNGVSSRYGGRVSSVIDIKSESEIPDNLDGGLGLNMTQTHFELAAPIGKSSALFFSSRIGLTGIWNNSPTFESYAEKVFQGGKINVESFNEIENEVRFSDVTFKWIYNPGKNRIAFSALGSLNSLQYNSRVPNVPAFAIDDLKVNHGGTNLSWERDWSETVTSELSFTNTDYKNDYSLAYRLSAFPEIDTVRTDTRNRLTEGTLRMGVNWEFAPLKKLRVGYQHTNSRINFGLMMKDTTVRDIISQTFNNRLDALYTDYSMTVPDLLELNIGLRYQYSNVLKNAYFEPRISVSTDLTEHFKLKLSTSKNFQFVSQLVVFDTNDLGLGDQIWVASNNTSIPVIEANQWTGGILYAKDTWTLDVEAYVKELTGITSFADPTINIDYSTGTARISGIDLLLKRRFGKYKTWLSYSLSKANYEFLDVSPEAFPTTFDQKHVVQSVHIYKHNRFEWSLGLSMKTGLPYTTATGIENNEPVYGQINGSRLPNYARVDASMVFQLMKKQRYKSYLAVSIQNMLDQKNILERQYSVGLDENGEQELIVTDRLGFGVTPNVSLNFSF